jgi:hypothetical protein
VSGRHARASQRQPRARLAGHALGQGPAPGAAVIVEHEPPVPAARVDVAVEVDPSPVAVGAGPLVPVLAVGQQHAAVAQPAQLLVERVGVAAHGRGLLDALEDGAAVGQARRAPGVADGGGDDHATAWPVKVPAAKRGAGSTIRPAAS